MTSSPLPYTPKFRAPRNFPLVWWRPEVFFDDDSPHDPWPWAVGDIGERKIEGVAQLFVEDTLFSGMTPRNRESQEEAARLEVSGPFDWWEWEG